MMLTLSEVADLVGGTLIGIDAELVRVVTDSRSVQPGDLFVALKGEKHDAHDYIASALAGGAVAAIARHDYAATEGMSLIGVDDTHLALGRLAAAWRARMDLSLLGITGSNGKTTLKEMLYAILVSQVGAEAVLATSGNFNNDIGMPLTLLRLTPQHRYAVIEMGMNHPGELSYLTALARPDVAIVNNVLRAHLGGFDSLDGIASAKAEIFEGLSAQGTAVINLDDPYAERFATAAGGRHTVSFGLQHGDVHAQAYNLGIDGSTIAMVTPQGLLNVRLSVPGLHNVRNALAAVALASALEVDGLSMTRGLAGFSAAKGRLQKKTAKNGATVLDDTYNANPDSMQAALEVLSRLHRPHWLVMGDLGELGESAPSLHAEVGQLVREQGVDRLLTLGELSRHAADAYGPQAQCFDSVEQLQAYLDLYLPPVASVLVKGSRFMRMERVVDHLLAKSEKGA